MKNNKIKMAILWTIAVLPMIITIILYDKLPDSIAMHWNINGEVDRIATKFPNVFIMPILCLIMPLFMKFLPKIDPKKENYNLFSSSYYWIKLGLILFLGIINMIILLSGMEVIFIKVDMVVKFMVSGLILLLGNLMPKIKHNFFVGIKTPWTIANEDVWFATHRHTGNIWFISGVILGILSFIGGKLSAYIFFTLIISIVLWPMIYSYLKYSKMEKKDKNI